MEVSNVRRETSPFKMCGGRTTNKVVRVIDNIITYLVHQRGLTDSEQPKMEGEEGEKRRSV